MKIGYLIPNTKAGRYNKEKAYLEEKGREFGVEVLTLSAEYDDKLQIEQANELMDKGAKVLIVNSVNLNTAAAIVRNAHDRSVKVIASDRMIQNCDLDYYISFDNVEVGRLMARHATRLKPEGKYFMMCGDRSDKNALFVKQGQMEILQPFLDSKKIKIIYDIFIEDYSGDNAAHELKRFLDLSQEFPDAILTSYDGMGTSSIKILENYQIGHDVVITGQDAELEACRSIVAGKMTMTVYKSLKDLSYASAELAVKIMKGEAVTNATAVVNNGFKDVPSILLTPVAVDKDNIKSTVIADGLYMESEVYQ